MVQFPLPSAAQLGLFLASPLLPLAEVRGVLHSCELSFQVPDYLLEVMNGRQDTNVELPLSGRQKSR